MFASAAALSARRLVVPAAKSDHRRVDPEWPIEREDVLAIMNSLLLAHSKLDRILEVLGADEAEET